MMRLLQLSDYFHLLPFALNEPNLWYYSRIQPTGRQGMANYIKSAMADMVSGMAYPFIIFNKQTQTYIGSTRLFDVNMQTMSAQIGYTWIGSAYHGNAINKHCKYLLLEYAFEMLGIERIESRVDTENLKSIHSLTNIGYRKEGVLRSNGFRPDGSSRDSIVFSILKGEWLSDVKIRLLQLTRHTAAQFETFNNINEPENKQLNGFSTSSADKFMCYFNE